jgi:hypothetical protein
MRKGAMNNKKALQALEISIRNHEDTGRKKRR